MYRSLLFLAVRLSTLIPVLLVCTAAHFSQAQDKPYFVTYSQDLEEPGNLEIETKSATGKPHSGNRYGALATELEYGATAWWTTELYLDGQTTARESTIPTGVRWENRFRMLLKDHIVNPVLCVEFENITGADKTVLEVVAHDGQADFADNNADARQEHKHEGELKLILSSNLRDWDFSENFIAEGIWVCLGGVAAIEYDLPELHVLCREGGGRRRGLWRFGRHLETKFARHLALHRSSSGLESTRTFEADVLACFRLDRKQPQSRVPGRVRGGDSAIWPRFPRRCAVKSSMMVSGLALVITLGAGAATTSRWDKIPAKDHARRNPLTGNPSAVEGGAGIYKEHCAQCHGADAMGDGNKKPALKSDEIKNATDGDLEWFLRQGNLRAGMPSWSSLPQAQSWQIVAYLRALQQ